MRINQFRTLQGKFTLYLSVLIIGMMSALAYWNILREEMLMKEIIVRAGIALAESFAIPCTNTMLYEEIGLAEERGLLDHYISDLMNKKELQVIYAMVLDPGGKIVAHSSITETGKVYRDQITQEGLSSWKTILQYPSADILDISTPLSISTKRWGTLRIGISLENLNREISGLIWKYFFYTLGLIFIAIISVISLAGVVTKPLKLLSKEMDERRPGDDPPQNLRFREDEIGTLQKSFYRLLNRIKEDEKEKERTQRNLLLTEKMVAIGKLTSGVAHEINNPLGGILNGIYHFKKGGVGIEKQREYLDLMEDGIKRVQKSVTNLLEYARNPHLEWSPADYNSLVEKALSLLDYQIRKNRIEVKKGFSPNLPPVFVDANQMGQVLVNIFLNAIQAMEKGGILQVDTKIADHQLMITVSDSGEGIAEDILPKVFDPFFTTKGNEKGTGLGLWISQGIVERHGGTIRLTSEERRGTTVEIQLPLYSK
ncbi:MAG: hypothetical protein FJ106_06790 [Deltaproteobacteria bacterium]|nr:hypothetical protein [Deltaproteobacteria bacterium]